ncbi:GNAT family N-acetyltransferase [Halarcobacter ebronensis]|uniref:GNAT family N-acetyltransferase n=1 Tax=Halarcobacter ebronensis TaxID=1462615 RepID=A0A4Q1AQS8_9BACT|nr:GNAT family N-acetyltransferase [Halarcobacter ebronensis]QKF82514.1 acetyltransferase [Halarcobacter ebronensis]RXK07469.1 GNAT family N-acetyltransferase [Halarcobacter ebronensis]
MINEIDFKYVTPDLEKQTKDFIIGEYIKHYDTYFPKSQYEILYKKMDLLLLKRSHNAFFIAQYKNKTIGAISICEYDNRIKALQKRYLNRNIAEVGRCYIEESFRKKGIGSKLFELAYDFAKNKEYESLYLHTQYFLPGGYQFWNKMGFYNTLDEKDYLQTVHMERKVNPF